MTLAQAQALADLAHDSGIPALPWGRGGWESVFASEGHHVELVVLHPADVARWERERLDEADLYWETRWDAHVNR